MLRPLLNVEGFPAKEEGRARVIRKKKSGFKWCQKKVSDRAAGSAQTMDWESDFTKNVSVFEPGPSSKSEKNTIEF